METLRKSNPIAHKEHKCMWCGGIINKGEKYERSTHVYEGQIYDWVNHISCRLLSYALEMWDYVDEGLSSEDFYNFVCDKYADIMSEKFTEQWESKDFIMPSFRDKVSFLKDYYKIKK